MEVLIIKIKNDTDEVQLVDLNKITFGVSVETDVKNMEMVFEGLKVVTSSGNKVDSCFYNKSIIINGIDVIVSDWFSMAQHSTDYVNIKLRVDLFDSICFEMNPRKRIEIYVPVDKCNFELYKHKNTEVK